MKASKQQLKRLGKRGLSLFMAMTMCLSLIQISAFATVDPAAVTQANKQLTGAWDGDGVGGNDRVGDTFSYTGAGTVTTGSDWAVQLSRTLEATGTENLFNVNMEVVTKDGEVQVTNADAAVVLVLDTSGSMGHCAECGYDPGTWKNGLAKPVGDHYKPGTSTSCTCHTSRLQAAKDAVNAFLDGYGEVANAGAQRYVSLVNFYDDAYAVEFTSDSYWANVAHTVGNTDADLDNIKTEVSSLPAGGGTNTEAGFQLAYNLLKSSQLPAGISNKYVIFLSDGEPTYHLNGANSTTAMSFSGTQGGGDWSKKSDWQDLKPIADQITSTSGGDAAMYSLLYGDTASAKLWENDNKQSNNQQDETYPTVAALFNAFNKRPATGNILTPTTPDQLNTIFQNILNSQETSGSTTNGVTAAIGQLLGASAHAYTFIGFNDGSGLVLNGGTPATSYNGASVTADSLSWDLSAASSVRDDGAQTTTYSLSYQVRLNNNVSGFLDWEASEHAANAEYSVGSATLAYQYTDLNSVVHDSVANFPDVKAHGYLGHFDFMKIAHHQDANGNDIPLAGAPFQLTNSANAPLYVAANAMTQNTTSQADAENQTLGKVAFAGIPSGYAYTLSETGEFTYSGRTYQPTDDTWTVGVSYGVVSDAPSGNVENTLKQIPETKTLTKTWNLAPGSNTQAITVYLYQDKSDSPFATLTLNGATADDGNNPDISITPTQITGTQWVYTLTVPSINQGTGGNYSYRIAEESLGAGIQSVVDGMNITNTTTGITSVSVEKKWALIDGQDPSASMPDVKVQLTRTSKMVTQSENVGAVVTLGTGVDKSWNYEWNNLPAYDDNGQPYTYAVTEGQGNYQDIKVVKDGNHFTLYNCVLEGETTKTVTKTWNDQDDSARTPITVELVQGDDTPYSSYTMSADDETGGTVISSDGKTWSHTFTGLPQYQITEDDSQPSGVSVHSYRYTVAELTDVPGYTSVTNGDLGLINTRAQDVSIQVNKKWDDKNYVFDHGEVVIDLLRNGTKIAEQTTVDGTATFDEIDEKPLPQFNPATGEAYDYTVREQNVPTGYIDSYNYGADSQVVVFDDDSHIGTVTVTNTLTTKPDQTSVHVSKVWQQPSGTTAPEVTFTLEQLDKDGNSVNLDFASYKMTSGSSYTFANLPVYYYKQEPVASIDPETTESTTETVVKEYTYQYSVSESAIDGYNNGQPATPVKMDDNDWQFTNTRTGTVDLTVNKVWNDIDDSTRSDATITLQRASAVENGALTFTDVPGVDPLTTRGDDSKSWTVDQFDSAGQPYTYRVVENPTVSSYSTAYTEYGTSNPTDTYSDTVNSITVTNTLMPVHNYSFNASKTWMDNGNAANTREGITLTLLRNDEAQGTVVISANGALVTGEEAGTYTGNVSVTPDTLNSNKWNIGFTGLEKYYIDSSDGRVKQYTYSVAETLQPDSAYVQNNGSTDIVNTLKQIGISIPLQKVWVDPETTEHTNSVTFSLTATNAGGQTVTSVGGSSLPTGVTLGFNPDDTLPQNIDGIDLTTEDLTVDNWYYTFTDLPQYDDNQSKITYTIAETTNLDGYTKEKKADSNLFTNTIVQEYLDFDGQKVWNMDAQSEDDDYLKPGPQPVTIGLYSVDTSGSLSLVKMDALSNPVTVSPPTKEDSTTDKFHFHDLPRYDSNGSKLHYTVREIEITTAQDGTPGMRPIEGGGTLQLTVSDHNNPFHYNYTVGYQVVNKTPTEKENNGTDTTVTNTYQDPNYYFYRIIGNYYTIRAGQTTSDTGVNLSGTAAGYVIGNKDDVIKAITSQYTNHDGVDFDFDSGNPADLSVTLSVVNHLYTIELNYVRHLYTLSVNYEFPDGDKPADGFANILNAGNYLPGDTYSGMLKTAPTGFQITKVTVKNSDADASIINDLTYNGGGANDKFANHDVLVTYYYNRVVNPTPEIVNPSFTIQKIDPAKIDLEKPNSENSALITHDSADFQVYTDAGCTDENKVDGKVFSTSNGEKTINASDLGVGTWYLKESKAPTGYTASDTVWKVVVTRDDSQYLPVGGSQYVNKVVWTVAVTLNDENALTGEGNDLLVVPNTREYGYLTITKTVSGLEQNESNTFEFTVSGTNYGSSYSETCFITVDGNGTKSLTKAIPVPTGNYTVTEVSTSAQISSYTVATTNGSAIVTTANTDQSPAIANVTNTYKYVSNPDHRTTISGTKVWEDDSNRDGLRPDSIHLQLYQEDGTPIPGATADVLTTGDGAYTITYDSYLYPGIVTVEEIGYTDTKANTDADADANAETVDFNHDGVVPGYKVSNGTDDNLYTVTNYHPPEQVDILATKVWSSGTPQPVTLRLQANGQAVEGAVMTLDGVVDEEYTPSLAARISSETYPSEFTEWTGKFPGALYKYADGKLIDYSVTEDSLGSNWSYTTDKSALTMEGMDRGYAFTVTNSYSSGGGGGDSSSYYYRTDYVYTGYGPDGSQIYNDTVTGSVQTTGSNSYSFTAPDSANHGGYSFSLTSDADQNANLTGTSRSDPYVFTVSYEFTNLTDEGTPTGETPDIPTTPEQPTDIPEDAVPKADVPATGDNLALWIMAAAVSGVGLVWLSLTGKKRHEDENS